MEDLGADVLYFSPSPLIIFSIEWVHSRRSHKSCWRCKIPFYFIIFSILIIL